MKTDIKVHSFIKLFQILSFDIVLGSIAMGYLATRILNVNANPVWWVIFPLSVWVVYSMDHIIDSFKNKQDAIIYRHRFHYLNRKPILLALVPIIIITLVLSLLYLNSKIIILGLLLSIFIAFYFGLILFLKKNKVVLLQKELIIAFVYTSGIFIAPLYWYGSLPTFHIIIVILIIFLLAWLEGIMISWFDYEKDIKDGHTSFTVNVGSKNTRVFLIVGHMIIELIIVILLLIIPINIVFWALFIMLIMNLFLGLIMIFPEYFIRNDYYRLIGETVFLLPVLLIFA